MIVLPSTISPRSSMARASSHDSTRFSISSLASRRGSPGVSSLATKTCIRSLRMPGEA